MFSKIFGSESFEVKRFHAVVIVLVLISAGFFANSVLGKQSEGEKVTIVASELIGFEPMNYAISHHKVPEPEGVDIDLQTASMTEAELNTLANSEPVVGVLSNIRVGRAYNQGMEFEVMAPWYREGMGEGNMTVGQLVALKSSNVSKPSDLEGKKVGLQGINGGSSMALQTALRVKGVNVSEINFVGIKEETAPILLQKGELDAAMFDSDFIVREGFDDKYKTVIDFGKTLYNQFGAVPPSQFVVVRKDHYKKNPEKYEETVQWLRDNYEWARNHKKEISRVRAEQNDRDFDLLMDKFSYFSRIGDFTEKDLDVLRAYYKTAEIRGSIDEVPELRSIFEGALEREY